MHSYTIINIAPLTSQVGGKWLGHSGAFSRSTCRVYIDNNNNTGQVCFLDGSSNNI